MCRIAKVELDSRPSSQNGSTVNSVQQRSMWDQFTDNRSSATTGWSTAPASRAPDGNTRAPQHGSKDASCQSKPSMPQASTKPATATASAWGPQKAQPPPPRVAPRAAQPVAPLQHTQHAQRAPQGTWGASPSPPPVRQTHVRKQHKHFTLNESGNWKDNAEHSSEGEGSPVFTKAKEHTEARTTWQPQSRQQLALQSRTTDSVFASTAGPSCIICHIHSIVSIHIPEADTSCLCSLSCRNIDRSQLGPGPACFRALNSVIATDENHCWSY